MERIKKALERAREQRTDQPAAAPLKTIQGAEVAQTEVVQAKQTTEVVQAPPELPTAAAPVSAPPDKKPVAEAVEEPIVAAVEDSETAQPGAQESDEISAATPDKEKVRVKQPRQGASRLQSAVPSDIEYSQTRKVEISADTLESNRVIAGIKDHPQSDLFRVLRTKILHRMRVDKINSLAITSPTKGAGKSMVSANLAVSLAMEANQTVMLVDLDLRKPSIGKYFGVDAQQGVTDYLLEGVELPGLLFQPGIDRLVILPAGNPVPQSSELLSTPRMSHLVEDITNRYATRIVLFDLPPLLHLDDALIFLPQVKSSLLVLEEDVNTPAEIEQSLMLLEKSNMLGTVYNKARLTKHLPY
ncbi:MAG: P-loop NTPase [Gammaproteobacteria bacterium]|nr:P-loop NTPase [Gammaproteobacteria bacterium]